MIRTMQIKGFCSLKQVTWSPGRLNLIIGKAGSGKTNLVRAIGLLQDAARGTLPQAFSDQGGLPQLLWGYRAEYLEWRLLIEMPDQPIISYDLRLRPVGFGVGFGVDFEWLGTQPSTGTYQKETHENTILQHPGYHNLLNNPDPLAKHLPLLGKSSPTNHEQIQKLLAMFRADIPDDLTSQQQADRQLAKDLLKKLEAESEPQDANLVNEAPLPAYHAHDSDSPLPSEPLLASNHPDHAHPVAEAVREHIKRWVLIENHPVVPATWGVRSTDAINDARVDANGYNLVPVLQTLYTKSRLFKRTFNLAMTHAFGDPFQTLRFVNHADGEVDLKLAWEHTPKAQSLVDLTQGTLRFIVLIATLGHPNPAPVIAIDDFDAGLSTPMLQVIVQMARIASKQSQIFLTSALGQVLGTFEGDFPTLTLVESRIDTTQLATFDPSEVQGVLDQN